MSGYVCAHCIVEGVVQGVGFRYFTYRKAKAYGLSGFVRNLHDGSVETEVEGDKGLVNDFIRDLKIGPSGSHVTNIKVEWNDYSSKYDSFDITY